MANSKNLSFIEPKQERSKKRFEEVLKTAEFIYTHQENYALTVQDVSKLTGMKRPSIYKFFPSNESILEALSFKYASDLFRLIKKKGFKKIQIIKIPNFGSGIVINDRIKRASRF